MEPTTLIFIIAWLYHRENPGNIIQDPQLIEQQNIIMEEARGKMEESSE